MIAVNVYTAFTVVINFSLIVWISVEVYKSGSQLWKHYSVVSYSLALVALGALREKFLEIFIRKI